jgi:hypothetical protein
VANNETQSEPKLRTVLSVVLLAAYVAIAGWVFSEQSTSWPHEGSWALFAYLVLCPGILFQSFSLAYTRRTGRPLTRRALTRVVTIPLGLVIGAALGEWASALAMDGFEQAYAPLVSQLGANLSDPCGPAGKYFAIPAVAAYNEQTGRRPTARLKHDGKRFVLSFSGGSIDIDGSTIYYDSGAGAWRKFHNDRVEETSAFSKLTEGLAECKLRAQ